MVRDHLKWLKSIMSSKSDYNNLHNAVPRSWEEIEANGEIARRGKFRGMRIIFKTSKGGGGGNFYLNWGMNRIWFFKTRIFGSQPRTWKSDLNQDFDQESTLGICENNLVLRIAIVVSPAGDTTELGGAGQVLYCRHAWPLRKRRE